MIWLAIHFLRLGLEVFERSTTPANGSTARASETPPTVLIEDNRVVMLDSRARSAGIAHGSSLATAHSICRDLVHFNRDSAAESKRLAYLAELAYRYTPTISIDEPDCVLLEVQSSLALFNGLDTLVRQLQQLYGHLQHQVTIACAHTPLAALALARSSSRFENSQKRNAKQNEGADNFPTVEQVQRRAMLALQSVNLAYGELSARDVERASNMGIFRLGQMLALPRRELGRRFGPLLIDYLARLTGKKGDPRSLIVPRDTFASPLHLLESISNKDALLFPMQRLAIEFAGWLNARQLGAEGVGWTFKTLHGASAQFDVQFSSPRPDFKGILDVSKLKLENTELPDEIMTIVLSCSRLRAKTAHCADLFDGSSAESASSAELVDRLTARLGREALQGICTVDDHRPEFAWAPAELSGKNSLIGKSSLGKTSLTGRTGEPASRTEEHIGDQGSAGATLSGLCARPLWLFEPPRAANPRHFKILSGPERIQVGWWHDPIARDYYVALDQNGAQCWLFADGAVRQADECPIGEQAKADQTLSTTMPIDAPPAPHAAIQLLSHAGRSVENADDLSEIGPDTGGSVEKEGSHASADGWVTDPEISRQQWFLHGYFA